MPELLQFCLQKQGLFRSLSYKTAINVFSYCKAFYKNVVRCQNADSKKTGHLIICPSGPAGSFTIDKHPSYEIWLGICKSLRWVEPVLTIGADSISYNWLQNTKNLVVVPETDTLTIPFSNPQIQKDLSEFVDVTELDIRFDFNRLGVQEPVWLRNIHFINTGVCISGERYTDSIQVEMSSGSIKLTEFYNHGYSDVRYLEQL